jgi:hypothetical protein
LQIEVTYALTFNGAQYERECSARFVMNEIIGTWVEDYGVTNSAPLQQGFQAVGASLQRSSR